MMWKTSSAALIPIAVCTLAIGLAGACAINPQPLPPDTFDASTGVDAGSFNNQAAGDAAGAVPSADADAGTGGGGGNDSGDGGKSADASSDADISDAANDGSD